VCGGTPLNLIVIIISFSTDLEVEVGMDLNGGALMASHYGGKVWHVAMNPVEEAEVATVGQDKTLRLWDSIAYRQKQVMITSWSWWWR